MASARLLDPLRERDFARLWTGQAVSNAGDWVNYVALTALVFNMTGSAWMVAVLRACHAIPLLVIGPFAGVLVDRWNRKVTLIVVDVVRAGLVLLFPFVHDVGSIFLITIAFNVVSTLFAPAKNALIPNIVSNERLLTANSLSSTTQNMAMVIGPAVGGLILAGSGTATAFYVDSASFLFSAVAIASMAATGRAPVRARGEERTSPWQEMVAGFSFTRSKIDVRSALLLEVGLTLGWGCINVLAVVIASGLPGGGPTEYGLLLASIGAGSLLGALLIGGFGDRWPLTRLFPIGFLIISVAVAILAESRVLLAACLGYFMAGSGRVAIEVSATTIYQRSVPDGLRGRIFALRYTVTHISILAANQAAGLVTDAASVEPILLASSALMLICTPLAVVLLSASRQTKAESNS